MKNIVFCCLISVCLILVTGNANAILTQWDDNDIKTVLDQTQNLIDRTSGIKTRTENTLAEVQDISQSFRAGLSSISADLSDQIRYGLKDFDSILAMQREGLGVFLGVDVTPLANSTTSFDFSPPTDRSNECLSGSPCYQFREDLKDLLGLIRDLAEEAIGSSGDPTITVAVDFDQFIDLIDFVPGRALYPLYKVLANSGTNYMQTLPALFTEALSSLQALRAFSESELTSITLSNPSFLEIDNPTDEEFPQYRYDEQRCYLAVENYSLYTKKEDFLGYAVVATKFLGKLLQAYGDTLLKRPNLAGGFAEFLNIHLKLDANSYKVMGKKLVALSVPLKRKKMKITRKMNFCASLRAQLNIMEKQEIILAAINNITPASAGGSGSGGSSSSLVSAATGGGGALNPATLIIMLLAGIFMLSITMVKRLWHRL